MMKIHYKATRPNGFDFYSGTVDYAAHLQSGQPLKRITSDSGYDCCTGTVYHASDTPSETLIGGSWPCRLFEVAGRPVTQEDHKFGFRSMRVVREVPAWQALGPNGEAVIAHIERARSVTPEEVERLYAARSAARGAAWYAAKDAAWYAAGGAARSAARSAARGAAWYAAKDAAWYAAGGAARSAARGAARGAAWSAAGDAAEALVVRDLISEEHFNTLAEPWVSAVGEL